mmetsp:Transcript_52537/g.153069  ORF Transcript_52537/g.153069 Transcript_52537/m.153069 type:complete len:491 (+) Transcript_52537:179-1651(+)
MAEGSYAPGVGDPTNDLEFLVERVKSYQRTGQAAKEQWWSYCRRRGSVDFDPRRHDPKFLLGFLASAGAGAGGGVTAAAASEDHRDKNMLVHRVKEIQRSSVENRKLWHTFCQTQGGLVTARGSTDFDPARHEEDFLRRFVDSFDSGALAQGGAGGEWDSFGKGCGADSWASWAAWMGKGPSAGSFSKGASGSGKGADASWLGADASWAGADASWMGADASWMGADSSWKGADVSWNGAGASWKGADLTGKGADASWKGMDASWKGADFSGKAAHASWKGADATWKGADLSWKGAEASWKGADFSWKGADGSWKGAESSGKGWGADFGKGVDAWWESDAAYGKGGDAAWRPAWDGCGKGAGMDAYGKSAGGWGKASCAWDGDGSGAWGKGGADWMGKGPGPWGLCAAWMWETKGKGSKPGSPSSWFNAAGAGRAKSEFGILDEVPPEELLAKKRGAVSSPVAIATGPGGPGLMTEEQAMEFQRALKRARQ